MNQITPAPTSDQDTDGALHISIFAIHKMDCPCEEHLIRMKLAPNTSIQELKFYLLEKRLEVIHTGDIADTVTVLDRLELGSHYLGTRPYTPELTSKRAMADQEQERRALWQVLWINLLCFVIEVIYGIISGSMGLLADGLDMLADVAVYGLALGAVGASIQKQKQTALVAGVLQLLLAGWGIVEIVERFLLDSTTLSFWTIIIISLIALAGNTASLFILSRSNSREVHFEASRIFTSGDIIANIGVIISAIAISITGTHYPDLLIGSLIFLLVLRGAIRIITLAQS